MEAVKRDPLPCCLPSDPLWTTSHNSGATGPSWGQSFRHIRRIKPEICLSPQDFSLHFRYTLSRFSRPHPPPPLLLVLLGCFLFFHLLLPIFNHSFFFPHISFFPLIDVSNPLILFISHVLGSFLFSSESIPSLSSVPTLAALPSSTYFSPSVLCSRPVSIPSSVQPQLPTLVCYQVPPFFPHSASLILPWPFFPLQLFSSRLLCLPFICLSNVICPLIPSSSPSSALTLILL